MLLTKTANCANSIPLKITFLLAATLGGALTLCLAGERGQPAQNGILNFGKVNDFLFRGAEPDEAAFAGLKRLGVKSVIDLRLPGSGPKTEAAAALSGGILYTNIPFHGTGRPSDQQVQRVLSLLETLPRPIFVHCQHGCDRTGTIIACYRIQHDKWSNETALEEAHKYGLSTLERAMRKYVLAFGKPPNP